MCVFMNLCMHACMGVYICNYVCACTYIHRNSARYFVALEIKINPFKWWSQKQYFFSRFEGSFVAYASCTMFLLDEGEHNEYYQ